MNLEQTILLYDTLQLECDGMTKVLSFVLTQLKVKHHVNTGYIQNSEGGIIHQWIELEDGRYVDLRARMWLGDTPNIPHGVFNPSDYPDVKYEIDTSEIWQVPGMMYTILSGMQTIRVM